MLGPLKIYHRQLILHTKFILIFSKKCTFKCRSYISVTTINLSRKYSALDESDALPNTICSINQQNINSRDNNSVNNALTCFWMKFTPGKQF